MSKCSTKQGYSGWQEVKGMVAVLVVLASLVLASSASAAETAEPGLEANSIAYPTVMKPGGKGIIVVQVFDTGAGSTGGTVTMTDTLPPGLEATAGAGAMEPFGLITREGEESVEEYEDLDEENELGEANIGRGIGSFEQERVWNCSGATVVTCTTGPGYGGIERPIKPGYAGRIGIPVKVVGSPSTGTNTATVSGGGVSTPAQASNPVTIGSGALGFGLTNVDGWITTKEGKPATQAGSHPYDLQLNFGLNTDANGTTGGNLRDAYIGLPPGIVGDPHAVPQCSRQLFLKGAEDCPAETQVGVDRPALPGRPESGSGEFEPRLPVYNLVPPPGVPAEFGFSAFGTTIFIEAGVRSGSDYGITGSVRDLSYHVAANRITLWGIPSDASHNFDRCAAIGFSSTCGLPVSGTAPKALLTLPSACEGPLTVNVTADSWKEGEPVASKSFVLHDPTGAPVGMTGCEHLSFNPFLSAAPDTSFADTPAGLTVDVKVAQDGLINAAGLATSNLKDTTVTLPEGVAINPGQAAGLGACGPAEDGLTTEAEKAEGKEDNGPARCPSSSEVGTDEIETPLLAKPLKGDVYVMPSNPPHLQLLVTAEGEGVYLKLVGNVNLNATTGRLVTTFANTPELPFTDFKLSFSGGAQAALSTPLRCGAYSTTSDFTPWSSPMVADLFPSSTFAITAGTDGAACPGGGALPFTPSMIAGSTTDQAGGFTDFSLLLTRQDDQQRIASLQFKTPEGLLGMISKVPLCPEAQANAGTCSSDSQIGHTVIEAGPGPYPLVVPQPGQPPAPIYLTAGYKGAPYGLSIVVPLHVGPFTLQTQIVRAKIEVDPITTQLTITTDPLPTIIDGIPADLRAINAVIDKPGFIFNPTGCESQSFSGTAYGAEGSTTPIGSHFQVGSCRSLTFKPNFKVSTSGRTSRENGASLDAKILYPTGEPGANQASSQSNVKSVKVSLPKQLPSRLTTLQKACPSATFEANPASCPTGSTIGMASAVTPVLPIALTGPAYFVSYGNAKFPELVIVLQGYGVTVELHGETFISKVGITSSTFHQVPDVPITSFELTLPEGPHSALAANGNLCKAPLKMPTVFTGQNGAVIHQSTPIGVTGCPKHKAAKPKQKTKRKAKGKKGK